MTETTPDYTISAVGPTPPPEQLQENLQEGAAQAQETPQPERGIFTAAFTGTRHVCLMRAGQANGWTIPANVLRDAADLFNNRPSFVDHARETLFGPEGRSVKDLAAHITNAHWSDQANGIVADLTFYPQAAWLNQLADEAKNHEYFGLSADLWFTRNERTIQRITSVNSVDIVLHPAAGGTFDIPAEFSNHEPRTTNPEPPNQKGNHDMSDNQTPIPAAETPPAPAAPPAQPPSESNPFLEPAYLANLAIQNSGLPAPDADALRAQYHANPCSPAELLQRIELAKTLAAQRAELTTIQGLGAESIRMLNSLDKLTLATEKLLGVEAARNADVPRLSGIRELYDLLTGDYERYGRFRPDRVTFANATTSTMASVVANALNKVLVAAFEMRPQWWTPIVAEYDFPTMNAPKWITLGGIADLDTVSEGAPYTEKAWDDNAETSSFLKKGNYIGLTLEMIDRDDVGAVRQLPRKLGLAAARTLSATVAAIFTANAGTGPQLADTYYLFDSSHHSNLRTYALSADEWDNVIQAMFKQAELNSAKRLGIRPRYCLVPIELEKTALTIFSSDREPGTADNDANVRRMSDSVITVPEWTDANDWAAVASPQDLEGICIGYRYGRQPEIFVADSELTGSMFTNDEMRIKVRFIFTVGIADYRALHKSNVS